MIFLNAESHVFIIIWRLCFFPILKVFIIFYHTTSKKADLLEFFHLSWVADELAGNALRVLDEYARIGDIGVHGVQWDLS